MVEHSASVTIKAPVHQVYMLFTHFNDFPKFMSFVKEVTYYDEHRSHWVAQVFGQFEWDAVNEDWIADLQIGWRSTQGLENSGKVKFRALSPTRTMVDVYIRYTLPTGPLGSLGETFGISGYFDTILQKDLNNFALMVEQAPQDALDPMSSHYLFHRESATVKGLVTEKQRQAMANDPMMSAQALAERKARIEHEAELRRQAEAEHELARKRRTEIERQVMLEQKAQLEREAARRRQEQRARETVKLPVIPEGPLDPRITHAALARTLGDKDGGRARFPNNAQDPMTGRRLTRPTISAPPKAE